MRKFVTLGLSLILLAPVGVRTSAADQNPASPPPAYTLSLEQGRVSLKATDASLKTILLDLGKRLGIEVVLAVPADEPVTVTFEQLPLEQALRVLTAQYGQIKEYTGSDGKLAKFTVLPEQEGKVPPPAPAPAAAAPPPPPTETTAAGSPPAEEPDADRPKPFKFEFDPSAAPTAPPGQMPAFRGRR